MHLLKLYPLDFTSRVLADFMAACRICTVVEPRPPEMQELQLLKDKQVLEQALKGAHASVSGAHLGLSSTL